jgi:hypothetical protein
MVTVYTSYGYAQVDLNKHQKDLELITSEQLTELLTNLPLVSKEEAKH